jgi:hypothetical protein
LQAALESWHPPPAAQVNQLRNAQVNDMLGIRKKPLSKQIIVNSELL